MKKPNNNCTDWQTKVRCFKADAPESMVEKMRTIPEKEFCVTMPNVEPGPLGRPIDANLAVNYIHDLYDAVKHAYGPVNDADIDELPIEQLRCLYKKSRVFLNYLRNLNYGMSIDKDFAAKILSQPLCEGLRFYLCFKKHAPVDSRLSLVSVGIDQDGFDLKYKKPKTVVYNRDASAPNVLPAFNGSPSVKNVEMRSLNGEYHNPPYTIDWNNLFEMNEKFSYNKDTDAGLDRFILLNIATGQQELLKASK